MGIYKFLLSESFTHRTQIKPQRWKNRNIVASFSDTNGTWLFISNAGEITVASGYAWDGCSPKIKVFDLWLIGTPDGILNISTGQPKTYYASLIHDALCQFQNHPSMPYSRSEIDQIFLERLQQDGFKLAKCYYWAVRAFGSVYNWFTQA